MFNQELQFPVEWHHKIICAKDDSEVYERLVKVLRAHGFDRNPEPGGESSGGKYRSWRVSLTFNDRETMRRTGEAIAAIPGVKYLI